MLDVVISGSGPAGAYASYLCAKVGLDVVLLERCQLPRIKCCAGGVMERALRLLDFEIPKNVIEQELRGFHVHLAGHRYVCKAPARLGISVRRERFDQFMTEKAGEAGAELVQSTSLLSIVEKKDRVESITSSGTLESRFLVLAEGANSRNARRIFGPFPKGAIAVGAAAEIGEASRTPSSAGFHLLEEFRESRSSHRFGINGAVFPLSSSIMASVVGTGRTTSELTHALNQIIKEEIGSLRTFSPCFHAIPMVPRQMVCNRRILAVGDAAGFVSPFSGEGITYALTSSILAAHAIEEAGQSGRAEDIRGYESACKSEIIDRMKMAEKFGSLLLRYLDRVDPRMVEVALKDTRLVSDFTSFTRGELSTSAFVAKLMTNVPKVFARSKGFTRA